MDACPLPMADWLLFALFPTDRSSRLLLLCELLGNHKIQQFIYSHMSSEQLSWFNHFGTQKFREFFHQSFYLIETKTKLITIFVSTAIGNGIWMDIKIIQSYFPHEKTETRTSMDRMTYTEGRKQKSLISSSIHKTRQKNIINICHSHLTHKWELYTECIPNIQYASNIAVVIMIPVWNLHSMYAGINIKLNFQLLGKWNFPQHQH